MNAVVEANVVWEWSIQSDREGDTVEVNVDWTAPEGSKRTIPAFWRGGKTWSIRFASSVPGEHQLSWREIKSESIRVTVEPYRGDNPLLKHGPITTKLGEHIFRHADRTPFFWLADTWWMGLCDRLHWPGEFQRFALDRLEQGFNVIHLVAGLYPDMPPLHDAGKNEAGKPWDEKFTQLNPAYFDYADRRIQYLCSIGISPCIFGCWGYFAKFMGVEKLKKHWRNLIARWGAYPITWSLAGEAVLPYYLDEKFGKWDEYTPQARKDWTEIGRYVRSIEPFGRPITIHPPNYMGKEQGGHDQVEDRNLLDFDMLQTAHGSQNFYWHAVTAGRHAYSLEPAMPVIQGEGFYEGILESCREETQRWFFWSSILTGAAGHSYGANGIWQLNRPGEPFRANPMGMHWGDIPWQDAAKLSGAKQIALGKKLLETLPWYEMQPHQEWLELGKPSEFVRPENAQYMTPYCAGIPNKLRLIYWSPNESFLPLVGLAGIEKSARYNATLINPSTIEPLDLGEVKPDSDQNWKIPKTPITRDWLLMLST